MFQAVSIFEHLLGARLMVCEAADGWLCIAHVVHTDHATDGQKNTDAKPRIAVLGL